MSAPTDAAPKQWDLAAIGWTKVGPYLDAGWEPFAVVQREPHTRSTGTEATVYLRRARSAASVTTT